MTAANLLIEEFLGRVKYMEREDDAHWLFIQKYVRMRNQAFVLGLFEDIEIINSLIFYLFKKKQNISEKIQDWRILSKQGLFLCAIIK